MTPAEQVMYRMLLVERQAVAAWRQDVKWSRYWRDEYRAVWAEDSAEGIRRHTHANVRRVWLRDWARRMQECQR